MTTDRCTETEPHPAHRTDYGPFGVRDCAGVRMPRPVDAFNAIHPVGTPVRYWKGVREGEGRISRTRTPAQMLSGHTAIVWLEGVSGGIALTHVEPLPADTPVPPRPVPSPADRLADARTATQSDDEAAYQALTAELRRVRGKLGEAHADCARLAQELATMTEVARSNKRHNAYLLGIVERVNTVVERLDREGLATIWSEALRRAFDDTATEPAEAGPDEDQAAIEDVIATAREAFAAADNQSERVEAIRDLLDDWYSSWPDTAVTDPHEPIAWELAALIAAAEARASAPSAAASVPPRRAQEEPPRLTSDPVGLRSVQAHADQLQAERHHAQGYAEAVASLRDDARYLAWWTSSGVRPDGRLRHHLADYLEAVGPDGPDVTKPAPAAGHCGTCWACHATDLGDPAGHVLRAAITRRSSIATAVDRGGAPPEVWADRDELDLIDAVDELLAAPACVDLSVPAVTVAETAVAGRCPSRIAHESGVVLACQLGAHDPFLRHATKGGVVWTDDDDRVIAPTPPTGDPTNRRLPSHWTGRCGEGCTGHPEGGTTDATA
jgi:hypothetical protein